MVAARDARILMVSAVASGQGKTTVTAALARKLRGQGLRVCVFKTGPDFIDPMLLERASGAPVYSLDLWMVGADECRRRLWEAAAEADAILIEGVMGLYDGSPSSADLAREFGIPVMAVIDASAMAQTAGALVLGLRDYGPVDLAGVIANRVANSGHADMVARSLRDVPLLATLPRQMASLPERHLGLVLPNEIARLETLLEKLANQLVWNEDAWNAVRTTRLEPPAAQEPVGGLLAGAKIAIARDEAFSFLYPANLECLRALGAELTFFSPVANQPVPGDATAVYLPGGYPELHGDALSQAARWHESIRAAHAAGMPILAECGGMMAIADTMSDQTGAKWRMPGLMPGAISMHERLSGLGVQGLATPKGLLRGHTFHYSKLETSMAPVAHTVKHPSGVSGEAFYRVGSLSASYFHAYFPSNPRAAAALFTKESA